MGNYPAPVGALKVNGGIVMLEDLPDVDAGSQGGITYDDGSGSGFDIPEKVKEEIDFTRRPETLSIDEFARLL